MGHDSTLTLKRTRHSSESRAKSAHVALVVLEGEGRLDQHVDERRQLLVAEHRLEQREDALRPTRSLSVTA